MENETEPIETSETFDLSDIMDEFSRQLKDSTEWNREKKDFPWNTSSTQNVSVECLSVQKSDQNDDTITGFRVVDMMNSLFAVDFHNKRHSPYLGPNGISEWILTNLINRFKQPGVLNWFMKHSNLRPYELYARYLLIKDFIAYCANELRIGIDSVEQQNLSNQDLYLGFALKAKLDCTSAKIMESLFRHFQPFLVLKVPSYKRTITSPLSHPLVERHLQALKLNGRTQASIYSNRKACREFLTWLCQCYRDFNEFDPNNVPLHLIKQTHLLEYRLHLKRRILTELKDDKSVSTDFYYVRSLFQSLHRIGLIKDDVASDVKGLAFENYHYRDIPNNDDLQCFFEIVRTYSPDPSVHLLIYSLLLYLGLRISEAINLCWENFNQSTWSVSIKGKDGQYSIMPLPEQIKDLFQHYPFGTNGSIVEKSPKSYLAQLARYHHLYCLVAGWSFERRGFHLFRHTYITKLSEHPQCTPKLLMKLARHVKPASTSIYIHRSRRILQQAVERIDYNFS
jgi:integrase